MADLHLSIARDYSTAPAGRKPADGPYNGERFREQFLKPRLEEAWRSGGRLFVSFDGADSYSSSFLEEAFGGLARALKAEPAMVLQGLEIVAEDPIYDVYAADAQQYIREGLTG